MEKNRRGTNLRLLKYQKFLLGDGIGEPAVAFLETMTKLAKVALSPGIQHTISIKGKQMTGPASESSEMLSS